LCAVHCAVTPLVLVMLPFLGWQSLEWPFRLGAVSVGIVAVGAGAAFHKNRSVVRPLLIGIALIAVASLLHWAHVIAGGGLTSMGAVVLEVAVSIAASASLIRAHWLNSKACSKVCHDCPPAHTIAALPNHFLANRVLAGSGEAGSGVDRPGEDRTTP
jgi:hypothetical protein